MSHKAEFDFARKLDAAERQLDTAIWLWFNDCDLVSINNLAGSALIILDDLMHDQKRRRAMPFESVPDGLTPREWRNIVKEGYNFAKHARKDPSGIHGYSIEGAAVFLYLVARSYFELVGFDAAGKDLRSIFIVYFAITHPACFESYVLPEFAKDINLERAKKLSRDEFLQQIITDLQITLPRFPRISTPLR